jgi:outer membrane protein OmpA-like peptidoglycan-associated protein
MDNPDIDGDSLCAGWVAEKNMQAQFKDICHGIDKCPTENGPEWNKGCPTEDPDGDKDGVCDAWVSKQKMTDKFKEVCTGIDRCPDEEGPAWNKGCPAENPDSDGDSLCDAWVGKQKMFDQFKEVCHGTDRCPDEAGPECNKGCPMDDDPDADKDGVCSEWVSTNKHLKQFEGVCTGLDRCPDVAGDDGHGCPKKAVEKLTGVTFKPGKATLESNAKNILKAVAKKLNEDDSYKELKIVIQGHTDNKGKDKTNQKLSEKRAQEVMKTLIKFGVKKNRIKAVGLGASCPVDDNSTEDGREMNRRIEMHFATPENDGTKCESEFQQ